MCSSVPFFPLSIFQIVYTSEYEDLLPYSGCTVFNQLSEGDVGCFQASITVVKAAMASLVGGLFAHLSGTGFWPLCHFPVTASSAHFPPSIASDSSLGFSLANLCPGGSNHFSQNPSTYPRLFSHEIKILVPRASNIDCKIVSFLGERIR